MPWTLGFIGLYINLFLLLMWLEDPRPILLDHFTSSSTSYEHGSHHHFTVTIFLTGSFYTILLIIFLTRSSSTRIIFFHKLRSSMHGSQHHFNGSSSSTSYDRACMEANTILLDHLPQATSMEANTILQRGGILNGL